MNTMNIYYCKIKICKLYDNHTIIVSLEFAVSKPIGDIK